MIQIIERRSFIVSDKCLIYANLFDSPFSGIF